MQSFVQTAQSNHPRLKGLINATVTRSFIDAWFKGRTDSFRNLGQGSTAREVIFAISAKASTTDEMAEEQNVGLPMSPRFKMSRHTPHLPHRT